MKEYKHYPFLDKEVDIAGLEPFELLLIAFPLIAGIVLFIISPIKIPIVFTAFAGVAFMYIFVRKKKSGKNKGYMYREVIYNYTISIKKIY